MSRVIPLLCVSGVYCIHHNLFASHFQLLTIGRRQHRLMHRSHTVCAVYVAHFTAPALVLDHLTNVQIVVNVFLLDAAIRLRWFHHQMNTGAFVAFASRIGECMARVRFVVGQFLLPLDLLVKSPLADTFATVQEDDAIRAHRKRFVHQAQIVDARPETDQHVAVVQTVRFHDAFLHDARHVRTATSIVEFLASGKDLANRFVRLDFL